MTTSNDAPRPLFTCATCGRELTEFSGRKPMADERGVFHAADCPRLTEPAPAPSQGGEISEEMVERALAAAPDLEGALDCAYARKLMRAALAAALTPTGPTP